MEPAQIVMCAFYLALAMGSFTVSWFQFQEKGYLFNNYYFWASKEERRRMTPEDKRPYYRQSGGVFLLIGVLFLLMTAHVLTEENQIFWMFVFILFVFAAIVYAIASSIKLEQRKSEEK